MTNSNRRAQFLEHCKKLHGTKYDYTLVEYVNAKTPVRIICKMHGEFAQTPDQHIRTYNTVNHKNTGGCPICSQQSRKDTKRKSVDQLLTDFIKVHGQKYDYSKIEYVNIHTKVTIICPTHGEFNMTPKDHTVGKQGCRQCAKGQHSKIAIRWLQSIERELGIELQRIGNGGEYKVPGTRLHVDGYHAPTNTIYEFYGDKYHGNPIRFKSNDKCHPYDKTITANQLYTKTTSRENKLKKLGYNLVIMWEYTYRNQLVI